MEKFDIAIIGAGVIGLAIARELSLKYKNIIVLEKNISFGRETSSRNSEVIHGGMYYPANSLKAKLCVEGRRLLYELCKENNIPCKKLGKLIVARDEDEIVILEKLLAQGECNEVENLRMVSRQELALMEPNISGIAALYSPETGIINSHRLMQYFLDNAKENNVTVAFNSEVFEVKRSFNGYELIIKNNSETISLSANVLINCAGLDSDIIAGMVGMDVKNLRYELFYCKGDYFRVADNKAKLISRLIYPVPKPKSGGLGVHVTLDLAGGMRLGPDDKYLINRVKDYSVDGSKKFDFFTSVKKLIPFIEENSLFPDTSGIRPKLQEPEGSFRDFVISDEEEKGFPGLINLIGIESPGLTASVAISKFVKKLICKKREVIYVK